MYRVMLADDEGIVIDSLKYIIEKSFPGECEIETAKTGRNVIELAESFRPDISFMDIKMPGINGIEAIREIQKFNSKTVFIVLTAYDKFDYAKEAINLGVLEYVNKPFDKEKIETVLRKAMEEVDKERNSRREKLEIKEKFETIMPIIETGLIQNLLFHTHFQKDIDTYRSLLGIIGKYAYMMVIVNEGDLPENQMRGAVAASLELQKNYSDIRMIIENYFNCIIGSVMGNKIPVLVPYEKDELSYENRAEIVEQASKLGKRLYEELDLRCRIGIGSVRMIGSVSDSYSEALTSLFSTSEKVAHAEDIRVGCEYEDNYPVKTEKELFEAISAGNVQLAEEKAGRFFEWMRTQSGGSLSDIRLKILEFVLRAEHIVYSNGGHLYRFNGRAEYLPEVCSMENPESLKVWFIEHIDRAVIMLNSGTGVPSEDIILKAKEYIDKHYKEDISLESMSCQTDISPYYFSKLFKHQIGVTFIDYLTNLRIAKAKELLRNPQLSMKEICSEVGYNNPNYFSRIFKKSTGMTPTEYKEGEKEI